MGVPGNKGRAELAAFHKRVLESLKIAFGVFMSGDVNDARKLIAEKAELRNAELAGAERQTVARRKAGVSGNDVAAT
jgi:Na+/phosphate symporter